MENAAQEKFDPFFETPLWMQIWEQKLVHIVIFSVFLIFIILVMIFRDRLAKRKSVLDIIKYGILGFSFVYVGLILKAQPTTTNIIILVNSLRELQFPIEELYLLEPFIFLSFVFIFVTLIIWGRGVFCGWLCPYGAMTELLYKFYEKMLPKFRLKLSERIHWRLIYLKYIIFLLILGVSFLSFIASEYLTEIEPFRTFVLKLNRVWYFNLYFLILTFGSVLIYRAFCRYLCPLGAALAIPFLLRRIPLIKLKRYDFCSSCKICTRTCTPRAIAANGFINTRECLSCLDCQINFWDEDVCPVLIRQKKREGQNMKSTLSARSFVSAGSILLVLLVLFLSSPKSAFGDTLIVDADYKTIGEALREAKDGDTIEVRGGEYREKLNIQRAVKLKGINNPVITAERGHIIDVSSPDVVIEGFTLRYDSSDLGSSDTAIFIAKSGDRTTVKNNRLLNIMFGIWNVESSNIRVENNVFKGQRGLNRNYRGNCINLTGTQKARIIGNELNYCRDGIYMELCHDAEVVGNMIRNSRYSIHTMWVDRAIFNENTAHDSLVGLAIMYTKHSEIKGNLAYGNQTHGLLLIQTVRSEVMANTVIGNTKGVFLYNSIYNKLYGNLVMNNQLGMHSWGGSEDNTISGNTFIGNEIQVKFVASRNQQWTHNYWSDYIGWDMTGDAVGDFPYESNSVVDHILWRYPLAKVLFTSPSLQLLWILEKQFPVLKVPRVVDNEPSMSPFRRDWKELKEKYPYTPERFYGEIEKLPHMPGGGF